MNNAHGLDADYFIRLCAREFSPDVIRNQNPQDLARAFARAARTACAKVLREGEFQDASDPAAPTVKAEQVPDDQAYDRNAERLTDEALGTGSGINMAATSIDELFDEPSPSLPAAGSAGEEAEVVAHFQVPTGGSYAGERFTRLDPVPETPAANRTYEPLMTVAQHERIVGQRLAEIERLRKQNVSDKAAMMDSHHAFIRQLEDSVCRMVKERDATLSAQQSAHVSVPRELLSIAYQAVHALAGMKIDGYTERECAELRALLNGGEA